MSMAPHPSVFLGLLLASTFTALARASSGKDETPIEGVEDKFLRTCCANTTEAAACYNSLLPRSRSFQGNLVKVAIAATIIAYEQLHSFDAELRNLLRGGTGAGESVDRAVESCVTYFEEAVLINEDEALAKLLKLETIDGSKGNHAKSDLHDVKVAVDEVFSSTDFLCMDGFINSGNAVLALPVGKMMLAGNATVTLYGGIALDLIASIKL